MKKNEEKIKYDPSIYSLQDEIDSLVKNKLEKKIHQWFSRKRIDRLIEKKVRIKNKLKALNNFERGENK